MSILNITDETPYYPAAVALEVTLRCNMRCLHCGSSATNRSRENELSLEEWKNIIDQLVKMGSEFITLSGGEPFVWPHWRELSAHISKKGAALSIISNGYNISADDVKFLKENKMWNVGLSLDGAKKTHDHIRQMNGSFDRVVKSISLFKEAGIKVGVSTSVNKLNFNELDEIKNIVDNLGVDIWQIQVVNSFGRAGDNKGSLAITQKQHKELVDYIYKCQQERKAGKLKVRPMPADSIGYCHTAAIDVWEDCEWGGCNAGRYVLGIQSDGSVSGCLSLQHKNFIVGNVRERKLKDIWDDDNSFYYSRKFTVDKLCGSCAGCSAGSQCKSGCLAMGYSRTGELYNNPYCYKHIIENGLC
ncbi:MAG: radical SAM protein [Deltaproteobacteria bacterium]|nr:radical SAM protein [Deltaproteobacteria bacterium]